jgi:superfamily I DNA and/or RNA helicase
MTTWSSSKMLNKGWHGGLAGEHAEVFDLVFIDEASQLKVCAGPNGAGTTCDLGRIIVAGDDRQLSPIGNLEEWEVDDRKLGGPYTTSSVPAA